jgi:hypothetical protein
VSTVVNAEMTGAADILNIEDPTVEF